MSLTRTLTRNLTDNLTLGLVPSYEGTLLFNVHGTNSIFGYSLYDLGNKRGSVTETEATYTNPVVRLRRDSDDALKSFTATGINNGSAIVWVGSGNNGYVAKMYDQSGNDRDVAQATTTKQPLLITGGAVNLDENNRYAPLFDGVDDILVGATSDIGGTDNAYTCFTVGDLDEAGAATQYFGGIFDSGTNSEHSFMRSVSDQSSFKKTDAVSASKSDDLGGAHSTGVGIWSTVDSGLVATIYEDGVVTTVNSDDSDVGTTSFDSIALGGSYVAGVAGDFLDGSLGCQVLYSEAKAVNPRKSIENLLAKLFGITLSVVLVWIMADGTWNDDGVWDDADVWKDTA